jgi:hypothetical protein
MFASAAADFKATAKLVNNYTIQNYFSQVTPTKKDAVKASSL